MSGEHLTDEQLSARLDGVRVAADEARIDAHLADCAVCAARVAEGSTLEASLGRALTHDPGDAYFADFSERVAARIAADPTGAEARAREAAGVAGSGDPVKPAVATAPSKKPAGRRWGWLASPRGLAFAGSAAMLVVAAGLGVQWFGQRERLARTMSSEVAGGRAMPAPAADRSAGPGPAVPSSSALGPAAPEGSMSTKSRVAPTGAEQELGRSPDRSAPATATESALARATATEPATTTESVPGALPLSPRPAFAPGATQPAPPSPPKASSKPGIQDAFTQSLRESSPVQKSLADAPAPGLASGAFKIRGGRTDALGFATATGTPLGDRCGTVRDTRGQPLAGAQLASNGARAMRTRSGADGRYCFESAPLAGDTLVVLHVGLEPVRVVLTGVSSLVVAMEPVGTLGPADGMLTQAQSAPRTDVYEREPAAVRSAVDDARAQGALAERERTADAYERTVAAWDAVAVQTMGAATHDARFRSLGALREAYVLAPEPARRARLAAALESFIAATPRTLPERSTVLRWQQELAPR